MIYQIIVRTLKHAFSRKLRLSSQLESGKRYYQGNGVAVNYQKVVHLFGRVAANDVAEAKEWLGLCYEKGNGVSKNIEQAMNLYQQAALLGSTWAQVKLGRCYEEGKGIKTDTTKAVELYQKAALQGNAWAQFRLGSCYEKGNGVESDIAKAVELYQKAALQGAVPAQEALGWCYEEGKGLEPDITKAVELYQKAALQGSPWAQERLGHCYEAGKGVSIDIAKAAELYQKAASHGRSWAAFRLGLCFYRGTGVAKNYKRAVQFFELAAKDNPGAQANLGICYEQGEGVPKDLQRAFNLYQTAAAQNNSWALGRLGVCYEYGIGTPRDFSKAADFYRQAVASNKLEKVDSIIALYKLIGAGFAKPNNQNDPRNLLKDLDLNKLAATSLLGLAIASDINKDYDTATKYYKQCSSATDFPTLDPGTRDDINLIVYFRNRKFTDYFKVLASSVNLLIYSSYTIKLFIPTGSEGYLPKEKEIILGCIDQWMFALNHRLSIIEVSKKDRGTLTFTPVNEQLFAGECVARTCYPKVKLGMLRGGLLPKMEQCDIQLPKRQIISADDEINLTKTCLHEIGHALGLAGHSIFADDIMFGGRNYQRVLSNRDIEAINSLYSNGAEKTILSILESEVASDNQYALDRLGRYYMSNGRFKMSLNLLSQTTFNHYYGFERAKSSKLGKFLFNTISAIDFIKRLVKGKKESAGKK